VIHDEGERKVTDTTPPFLDNQEPIPGTSGVLPTTNVFLKIVDTSAGVDLNTLRVYVDNELAVSGNTFLPNFSGPVSVISPEGLNFAVMIDPVDLFAFGAQVDIRAVAQDLSILQNLMDSSYSFFITDDETVDISPPEITFKTPASGTSSQTTNTDINLIIEDIQSGVDLFTVEITVNGQLAYKMGSSQSGFDVTVGILSTGYNFRIKKHQSYNAGIVTVRVLASDFLGNSLDEFWSFAVVEPNVSGTTIPVIPTAPKPQAGRFSGSGSGRSRRIRKPPGKFEL